MTRKGLGAGLSRLAALAYRSDSAPAPALPGSPAVHGVVSPYT